MLNNFNKHDSDMSLKFINSTSIIPVYLGDLSEERGIKGVIREDGIPTWWQTSTEVFKGAVFSVFARKLYKKKFVGNAALHICVGSAAFNYPICQKCDPLLYFLKTMWWRKYGGILGFNRSKLTSNSRRITGNLPVQYSFSSSMNIRIEIEHME